MLARLKKNLADYSDRVQVVSADFFDHDFGFEFYDGATATMALHYYSEAQKLQLYKNLRVGIKKDDTQLATRINNAIADMIQDGSWQRAISDNTKGTAYTPNAKYNPPEPTEGEK